MTDIEFAEFVSTPIRNLPIKVAPPPIEVTLTERGHQRGIALGNRRQNESVKRGLPDAHGFAGADGLLIHINGACGEIVVSEMTGIPFEDRVNTFKAPDLGRLYQVKTRSQHHYELIVRDDDDDDKVFILVTGQAPHFVIRGWLYGRDAKKPCWLHEYGGRPAAWFVPHAALKPMDQLPRET